MRHRNQVIERSAIACANVKENVIFLSGTDCYGSPILESYRKLKEAGYKGTMENYVASNHESQKKTLDAYGISLDLFCAYALGEAGEMSDSRLYFG